MCGHFFVYIPYVLIVLDCYIISKGIYYYYYCYYYYYYHHYHCYFNRLIFHNKETTRISLGIFISATESTIKLQYLINSSTCLIVVGMVSNIQMGNNPD